MTIEERAKKYCESYKDSYKGQAFQDFMAGAAEQHKIDTDKACQFVCSLCEKCGQCSRTDCPTLVDVRKAMEG